MIGPEFKWQMVKEPMFSWGWGGGEVALLDCSIKNSGNEGKEDRGGVMRGK